VRSGDAAASEHFYSVRQALVHPAATTFEELASGYPVRSSNNSFGQTPKIESKNRVPFWASPPDYLIR